MSSLSMFIWICFIVQILSRILLCFWDLFAIDLPKLHRILYALSPILNILISLSIIQEWYLIYYKLECSNKSFESGILTTFETNVSFRSLLVISGVLALQLYLLSDDQVLPLLIFFLSAAVLGIGLYVKKSFIEINLPQFQKMVLKSNKLIKNFKYSFFVLAAVMTL